MNQSKPFRNHRALRLLFAALIAVLSITAAHSVARADSPGVTPSTVTLTLPEGGSTVIPKSILTPPIPPRPDIVFLADTTGSMGPTLANVQANATTIMNSVRSAQADSQFGVANYRDFHNCPIDGYAYNLDQAVTASISDAQNAINSWNTAPGLGCDTPEQQLNALFRVATGPTGFRTGATRIVVWFGDSSGPDPSFGHTLADVIAALQAAGIEVIAIPVNSGFGDGLDSTGQATAITSATGGELLPSATPDEVSNAILTGLHNLSVTVSPSVTCDSGISLSFDNPSQTVTSGDTAGFNETVSIDPSATPGSTLNCTVDWLLNGMSTGDPAFVETISDTLPKHDTVLTYTGDTSADFNDPATLSAHLIDKVTGNPISGATVNLSLDGQSCAPATTDGSGDASCNITPNEPAGSYTASATFAGDGQHNGSSDSKPFTVNLEESAVASTTQLQVFAVGGSAALSATLTDPDGGAPIAGKTLTLTLTSTGQSCTTGLTDASGNAGCTINPVAAPLTLGPTTVTDSFAGDSFYKPSSNVQKALIFAFPAGGVFVVGDKTEAALRGSGTSLNFWGAQWAKNNSLSGGAAPDAFKGFADHLILHGSSPICGDTYTTDPGNSAPPPAGPLPSYMGIIVSSTVSKSGSTISGNMSHVIVVTPNGGYAPDPGHAGSGPEVASYC